MKTLFIARLLPVVLLTAAAGLWFYDVESGGSYALRNLAPPGLVVALSAVTLWRGRGRWTGSGWRMALGTAGFAVPALGLSAYLHYAYSVNLNDMFGEPASPGQLFRFLPVYTTVAGGIGFAIGWIVGRNL